MVGVYVTTEGDRGFLHLRFQVNGKPIAQTFELAGSVMRVGGVRWTVKCPESGKMVRDLYLLLRPTTRIFVRAMPWACPTVRIWPKKRHWERAKKLMDRLGARWGEPPIRPKNMQRRTFERLADELFDACLRDASAILGPACALRGLPGGDVVWKKRGTRAWAIYLRSADCRRTMSSGMARLTNIDLRRRDRGAATRRINECRRGPPSVSVADVVRGFIIPLAQPCAKAQAAHGPRRCPSIARSA